MARLVDPEVLPLSPLTKLKMPQRPEMPWLTPNWMERRSALTSASPREHTLPPLVSTWADPLGPVLVTEAPEEEIIIEIEETDTGDHQVPTTDADHHLPGPGTDTDLDPEAIHLVVITETRVGMFSNIQSFHL